MTKAARHLIVDLLRGANIGTVYDSLSTPIDIRFLPVVIVHITRNSANSLTKTGVPRVRVKSDLIIQGVVQASTDVALADALSDLETSILSAISSGWDDSLGGLDWVDTQFGLSDDAEMRRGIVRVSYELEQDVDLARMPLAIIDQIETDYQIDLKSVVHWGLKYEKL